LISRSFGDVCPITVVQIKLPPTRALAPLHSLWDRALTQHSPAARFTICFEQPTRPVEFSSKQWSTVKTVRCNACYRYDTVSAASRYSSRSWGNVHCATAWIVYWPQYSVLADPQYASIAHLRPTPDIFAQRWRSGRPRRQHRVRVTWSRSWASDIHRLKVFQEDLRRDAGVPLVQPPGPVDPNRLCLLVLDHLNWATLGCVLTIWDVPLIDSVPPCSLPCGRSWRVDAKGARRGAVGGSTRRPCHHDLHCQNDGNQGSTGRHRHPW
jgi:hypothetical protein